MLASVVAALAIYQVLLLAVCYGRLRIGFLQPPAAGWAHRAVGDSIVVVSVVLALKILVVRRWHSASRYLPSSGSPSSCCSASRG